MIQIYEIFPEFKTHLEEYKVHLAQTTPNGDEPLDAFKLGEFDKFQANQNRRNFEKKYIFSLIQMDNTKKWLYAGIYKSNGYEEKGEKYCYNTELTNIQKDLIGRLIFQYNKKQRNCYPHLNTIINDLTISEIRPKKVEILEFSGYESLKIAYPILRKIIFEQNKAWKTALSNIKGIYLISDKKTGKLYVGAAYGSQAFWTRWSDYMKDGSGGNKELEKVLKENSPDYVSNFSFSILEIHSNLTDDEFILEREKYWKDILLTKEFGYNEN